MNTFNQINLPLTFIREFEIFTGAISVIRAELPALEKNISAFLQENEIENYQQYTHQRRQQSFLLGRFSAKLAIHTWLGVPCTAVQLTTGVFKQPIVLLNNELKPQVSISHGDDYGAAIAFSELHPMGIDIEKIAAEKIQVIQTQLTLAEIALINQFEDNLLAPLTTLLWSAKEALSKTLRSGMMAPFSIYEIKNIMKQENYWEGEFKNFYQYKFLGIQSKTLILVFVLPKKSQCDFDIAALTRWLQEVNA
jgi:4'-phosphopantetheinyl transferase